MDKRVKASKHWVSTKEITAKEAKANKNWKKGYLKGNGKGVCNGKPEALCYSQIVGRLFNRMLENFKKNMGKRQSGE